MTAGDCAPDGRGLSADEAEILRHLVALTGTLSPSAQSTATDLQEARVALAAAIGGGAVPPAAPAGAAPAAWGQQLLGVLSEIARQAVEEPQPDLLVHVRDVPVRSAGRPTSVPPWASGHAVERTLGPFVDATGRSVWFDLFRIVHQVTLRRAPGLAPFLSVPVRGFFFTGDNLALGEGSVWFASELLASGAPSGGYTGLRIHGGTLRFAQTVSAQDETIVPPAVDCTLEIELRPAVALTGAGSGDDARNAAALTPAHATFLFSGSSATVSAADAAQLTVYGRTAGLTPNLAIPAEYVEATRRIHVPYDPDLARFDPVDVRSTLFEPEGTGTVSGAAWALPVAMTSVSSLGEASGAGSLALTLAPGLSARLASADGPVALGASILLVEPGQLALLAAQARALGQRTAIDLWSADPAGRPSAHLELTWPVPFGLEYISESAGAEALFTTGSVGVVADRPVAADGRRLPLSCAAALVVLYQVSSETFIYVEGPVDPPPDGRFGQAIALTNALLVTTPAQRLSVIGLLGGHRVAEGVMSLAFGLREMLPMLPDPYAASTVSGGRQPSVTDGQSGTLVPIVRWKPGGEPTLQFYLPAHASPAQRFEAAPAAANIDLARSASSEASVRGALSFLLLDVSTNIDQFGVAFVAGSPRLARSTGTDVLVQDMQLVSEARQVISVTLPAVLWEPIDTEEDLADPAYPSHLVFPNSGGVTALAVESGELVPIAAGPALDHLVANFGEGGAGAVALARFTLPFGLVAQATLRPPDSSTTPGAAVTWNRPVFGSGGLIGAHQISVTAIDSKSTDGTPGLEGSTIQLRNGLSTPAKSVLDDDVDTIFNGYLGPGGLRQLVPVTRIDLSGYGESLFSDWLNPTDDPVAVSQARFDVLVGRTSFEVVQVRSILYPYAVRVVRTITIERKNSGRVVRHDSGWQAVSDGSYIYPGAGLTTHPGVVRGIRAVRSIRDTGQELDVGGVQLAGVRFDGDLLFEGVVKGASGGAVPAQDQQGFVQLTPVSTGAITPAQYQSLIAQAGPLGGGADCVLDVGGSHQLVRVHRVGVGVTQGMGGPEFAMAAWGSPQFPQGGQWSFLRQTSPGGAPGPVSIDLGVPLIRAGAVPAAPPPSSPYRFADPADLAQPDNPVTDYGILHGTGTQRTFFPRPKIEATAPSALTGTRPVLLADPYTLVTAVGFFPRASDAIPLPGPGWTLAIDASGNYRLPSSITFPITVGERTITDAQGVRTFADYAGSTATIELDTSAAVPWKFELKDVGLVSSSSGMGEVVRLTTTVDAAADRIPHLSDPQLEFGGVFGVVQDVLKFFKGMGLPAPIDFAMTNDFQVKAGMKFDLAKIVNRIIWPVGDPPPTVVQFADLDITGSVILKPPGSKTEVEFEAAIMIPTSFPPLMAVGYFDFDLKMGTDAGQVITFTIGAGVGVSIGIFTAYVVETEFLILPGEGSGTKVIGLGAGLIIKGSLDFEVIQVEVSVEAKLAVLKVTCPDVTIYGVAQLTIAAEVTIAWVIDISFEWQLETHQNFNGGPCPLPDVL